jgi:alpha-beta hydrolase superfamily lysophospholipase
MIRATPLYFPDRFQASPGSKENPGAASSLFGWLHEPTAETNLHTGIILCDAVGHSDTRYLHRKLAEQLAAAGFTTMRFDYHGTGDSSGSDDEPGLVESWIDGINAAVDALLASRPLSRVCLAGFRLGGTLAIAAAARRSDSAITDLILWAPLARGKVLCREVGMAQTLHYGKKRSEHAEATLLSRHFFGFLPTPGTLQDLEALDVTTIEHRPALRAWLVQRGEQPIDPALIKRLEDLGVAITLDSVMTDPRVALHPNLPYIEPFAVKVKEWLGSGDQSGILPSLLGAAEEPKARPPALPQPSAVKVSDGVRESTLVFSAEPYLFGILSEPGSPEKARSGQAILFLTSGASQHIGPGRLYVAAARNLAAMGHTAFRFDLSGIGDSPASGENNEGRRLPKNAVLQVRLAMDALAKERGIEAFTLCGLCSGARLAFAVALADERVIDIQMINPPSLQMKREGYHPFVQLRHVLGNAGKWHRAFKGGMYSKLARRELNVLIEGARAFLSGGLRRPWAMLTSKSASPVSGTAAVGDQPKGAGDDAEALKSELVRLSRRGVKPVFIYSGRDRGLSYFNYFVKKPAEELGLPVLMYPEADHLFSEPHRELLLSIIARYLRKLPVSQAGQVLKQPAPSGSVRSGSGIHAALRDRASAAVQATANSRSSERSLSMAEPG